MNRVINLVTDEKLLSTVVGGATKGVASPIPWLTAVVKFLDRNPVANKNLVELGLFFVAAGNKQVGVAILDGTSLRVPTATAN